MPDRSALIVRLARLGTLATALLVYLPGLPGDFVFDDFSSIAGNPTVTSPHPGLAAIFSALFSAPVGGLLRPISMLSFMLNAQITGLAPLGFKLTNIFIHLACGVLLGFLAREIFRIYRARVHSVLDERTIDWLSLAVAALWLLHPLNLTAVLYVVQRETSLSALFSILAILAYLVGRRRGLETRGGRALVWFVTPFCILVGMLCKETAALVPVYLLVIEYTLLDFCSKDERLERGTLSFFGLFLAVPLLATLGLVLVKPAFFFASYAGRDFTLYERLLSECRILLDYLRWIFLPDLRQLGLFHDDIAASRGLLDPLTTVPAVVLVVAMAAAGLTLRRRFPWFCFGILWFLSGQLMESTVLPLELAFEHRNYLPIFGVLLACVGGLYAMAHDPASRRWVAAAIIAVSLLLACVTAVRAMDWHSELDFARSEARHHPGSPRAVTELQWAYMNYVTSTGDVRLIPAALAAAEQAKRVDPGSINQDVGLVYMYASIGRLPEAAASLQGAAARAPTAKPTPTVQLALQSLIGLAKPEFKPLHEDIRALYRAIIANPRVADQPCFYADVWNTFARFQEDSGQVQDALAAMHRAVTLCPSKTQLHYNMANMLLRYGDTRDAKPEIDAMRALGDFRYRGNLAMLEAEYARQTTPIRP